MHIKEIRQKFPQYSDLSDAQLVKGIHEKHYSDVPVGEFISKIEFAEEPEQDIDRVKAGLSTFAQGATFGLSDEILGALDPTKTREDYRDILERSQEQYPTQSIATDIAGGIAPVVGSAIATGGASLIPAATTTLGKMGIGAGVGTGIGLLEGFGRGEGGFGERAKQAGKTAAITGPTGGLLAGTGALVSKVTPAGRAAQVTKGRGAIKTAAKSEKATKEIARGMRASDDLAQKYSPQVKEALVDTESRVTRLVEKGLGKKNIQNEFKVVRDEFADALNKKGIKKVSPKAYKAINTEDEAGALFRKAQKLAKRANPELAGMSDDSIRTMQDTKKFLGQMERKGGVDSVTAKQVKREIGDAIEEKITGFKDLTTRYAKTLQADELADNLTTLKGAEVSDFAKKLTTAQNKRLIKELKGDEAGNKLINALRKESDRFDNLKEMRNAVKGKMSYGDMPTSKGDLARALRGKTLGKVDVRTAKRILENVPSKAKGAPLKRIMAIQPLIEGDK